MNVVQKTTPTQPNDDDDDVRVEIVFVETLQITALDSLEFFHYFAPFDTIHQYVAIIYFVSSRLLFPRMVNHLLSNLKITQG